MQDDTASDLNFVLQTTAKGLLLKSKTAEDFRSGIPDGSGPIWNAFVALSRTRTMTEAGPNPISFTEIDAWCRLTRTPLEPHHVEVIAAMDAVWLEEVRAYQERASGKGGDIPKPKTVLNAEMFDLIG